MKTSQDLLYDISASVKIIMICVAVITVMYAFNFFCDITPANAGGGTQDVNIAKVGGKWIGGSVPVTK